MPKRKKMTEKTLGFAAVYMSERRRFITDVASFATHTHTHTPQARYCISWFATKRQR